MDTRRDFIKKAAVLSGGLLGSLPPSIQQALAIDPAPGSTYLDAEHIVILMQENRSFDHSYGSLQGVRGFNDPRVILKADNNVAWLQKNAAGETYAPFRLNIKDTKATFTGSLPHSWSDQVDARNNGKYDQWLIVKSSGYKGLESAPLTLGYYNRQDIPFYYSLADAFTVCDQNFCSSLTGTTPNRLHLWSGTIREKQEPGSQANVVNSDIDYEREAGWTSFPERLEENEISWKIYQNEIGVESGLSGEEDDWLSNFGDNPIEYFTQYNVRFSATHFSYLEKMEKILPGEITRLKEQLQNAIQNADKKKLQDQLTAKEALLSRARERHKWSKENFDRLSQKEKNLHTKAFITNSRDPHYRELDTLKYTDKGVSRQITVPKGDVLQQFRDDVNNGVLPAVSWVVSAANFSDHPTSPWYGAWYVSEVLDILTKKPEVWKKTIFILCYDENDGYFDHVPPFVAPHPHKPGTGKVSAGIDTKVEYVTMEQDLKRTTADMARESAIGLGYRVPLVIASPWSRCGAVCSQVFDHTSMLRFMENFFTHKTGKPLKETNISSWRRTVVGDLSSVFKPYNGEKIKLPGFVVKDSFYESIHSAQFKKDPSGYKILSEQEIDAINQRSSLPDHFPRQEKGVRSACALPYELYSDGHLADDKKSFAIDFEAGNKVFGKQAAGSPFNVYAYYNTGLDVRDYAVLPGDRLTDEWTIGAGQSYHFRVNGPNGFFRKFKGDTNDPGLIIRLEYSQVKTSGMQLDGNINLIVKNADIAQSHSLEIRDNSYHTGVITKNIKPASELVIPVALSKSFGWYDLSVKIKGQQLFEKRYAGHVETGKASFTDPLMGNI